MTDQSSNGPVSLEQLQESWQRTILPMIASQAAPTATILREAYPVAFNDGEATFAFRDSNAFHREQAELPANRALLEEKLAEVIGQPVVATIASESEVPLWDLPSSWLTSEEEPEPGHDDSDDLVGRSAEGDAGPVPAPDDELDPWKPPFAGDDPAPFDEPESGMEAESAVETGPDDRPHRSARASEPDPDVATGFNLTDLGNAERLVVDHREEIRFVPTIGWHVWDGQRWKRDDDGNVVRRMKTTLRAIVADAVDMENERERKELVRHALRSEARSRVMAAIELAQSELPVIVQANRLDADPMLLNVANGTIDLRNGTLRPHWREDHLTKLIPIDYDPTANARRWQRFLEEIFPDKQLVGYVQRCVGYTLTGLTSEQILFLLYGSGANGKTTFVEILRALLGDYGQQAPPETFLERRDTIPNDVARLPGARLVAATETGQGRRLNEVLVKRMTGGDTLNARFMRQEWFEFKPVFKPWLATNHLPTIAGTDLAIWRRIRLIPFTVTFDEDERDPALADKLRAGLPGILAWAVAGCVAWQKEGLETPDTVAAATTAYRGQMDVLGAFLDECCVIEPQAKVKVSELYTRYEYWFASSGERDKLSKKAFGMRLAERGFTEARETGARWRIGLRLRGEDDDT